MPASSELRLAVVLALAVWACASPKTATGARDATLPRTGPACDSAIAYARTVPSDRGIQPPRPDSVFLPPFPVPALARGKKVRFRIPLDSAGQPRPAGIEVQAEGVPQDYLDRLRRLVAMTHFVPAEYRGCAVPRTATLEYVL